MVLAILHEAALRGLSALADILVDKVTNTVTDSVSIECVRNILQDAGSG